MSTPKENLAAPIDGLRTPHFASPVVFMPDRGAPYQDESIVGEETDGPELASRTYFSLPYLTPGDEYPDEQAELDLLVRELNDKLPDDFTRMTGGLYDNAGWCFVESRNFNVSNRRHYIS